MQIQTHESDTRPILVLGMIGFSPSQERDIDQFLSNRTEGAIGWRTGAISQADAWCVNGARAQVLADGSLHIGSAEADGRSIRLAVADVSRPIAFSEPLASLDLEPAYSFSIGEPASMCAVLDALETRWLACTPYAVRSKADLLPARYRSRRITTDARRASQGPRTGWAATDAASANSSLWEGGVSLPQREPA